MYDIWIEISPVAIGVGGGVSHHPPPPCVGGCCIGQFSVCIICVVPLEK